MEISITFVGTCILLTLILHRLNILVDEKVDAVSCLLLLKQSYWVLNLNRRKTEQIVLLTKMRWFTRSVYMNMTLFYALFKFVMKPIITELYKQFIELMAKSFGTK